MNKNLKNHLDAAKKISKNVGDFLLNNFGDLKKMEHKSGSHYSIKDDIKANDMYEAYLKKKTPGFGLYTEEGEKSLTKDWVWIVDPIEGTSNFRVGNPFFATQIALLHKLKPKISVVYAPYLKQLFYAVDGNGSFLNDKKIHVSSLKTIGKALISVGKGTGSGDFKWYGKNFPKLIKKVRTFRHFGACGLEMAYVASGKIDIYLNYGSKLYDYAPGVLLVKEAGGQVLTMAGKKWGIHDKDIILSNKNLSSQALDIIS